MPLVLSNVMCGTLLSKHAASANDVKLVICAAVLQVGDHCVEGMLIEIVVGEYLIFFSLATVFCRLYDEIAGISISFEVVVRPNSSSKCCPVCKDHQELSSAMACSAYNSLHHRQRALHLITCCAAYSSTSCCGITGCASLKVGIHAHVQVLAQLWPLQQWHP